MTKTFSRKMRDFQKRIDRGDFEYTFDELYPRGNAPEGVEEMMRKEEAKQGES